MTAKRSFAPVFVSPVLPRPQPAIAIAPITTIAMQIRLIRFSSRPNNNKGDHEDTKARRKTSPISFVASCSCDRICLLRTLPPEQQLVHHHDDDHDEADDEAIV